MQQQLPSLNILYLVVAGYNFLIHKLSSWQAAEHGFWNDWERGRFADTSEHRICGTPQALWNSTQSLFFFLRFKKDNRQAFSWNETCCDVLAVVLVGWLVGWLAGWLVGWLVGSFWDSCEGSPQTKLTKLSRVVQDYLSNNQLFSLFSFEVFLKTALKLIDFFPKGVGEQVRKTSSRLVIRHPELWSVTLAFPAVNTVPWAETAWGGYGWVVTAWLLVDFLVIMECLIRLLLLPPQIYCIKLLSFLPEAVFCLENMIQQTEELSQRLRLYGSWLLCFCPSVLLPALPTIWLARPWSLHSLFAAALWAAKV